MPLFTINADLRYVGQQLRRIADALEAMAPPAQEPVELKPDEAVTYVDEEKIAQDELRTAVQVEFDRLREEEMASDGGLGAYVDRS